MINIFKQLKPAANTRWTIYTATGKDTLHISVCNTSTATKYYICFVPRDWSPLEANSDKRYVDIDDYESINLINWYTPLEWMTIQVKSISWDINFSAYGKKEWV
jgi:hypothetical protein